MSDEIYGATSKPSTGHTRAINPVNAQSNLHQQIQFETTHFKIVAKRSMRGRHKSSHFLKVVSAKGLCCFQRSFVFRNDMSRTLFDISRQNILIFLKLANAHVAQ